jgi:hypothetical protein
MEVSGQLHARAPLPPVQANFKGVIRADNANLKTKRSLRRKRCSLTWESHSSGESATASEDDTVTAKVRRLLL